MKRRYLVQIVFISLFYLFFKTTGAQENCKTFQKKKVICYLASWATYRLGNGQFKISDIDPDLCTHIIYTFAGLSIDGEITSLDPQLDYGYNTGYKEFIALKNLNPCLKVLISIGGWNEGSEKYSMLSESPERRSKFVDQALRFVVHHGFDGIDFDWEYPTFRGGIPADRQNFVKLLNELKTVLNKRKKSLTVAVSGGISTADIAYELPEICNIADHIHVMAYDQHEPARTSYHSPLYPNLNASINFYIKKGCEKSKIILGIPSYGRSFTLQDISDHSVGAAVEGPGYPGKYTQSSGYLGFNEICELQKVGGWQQIYDKDSGSYFTYKENQWVSYDGIDSVVQKVEYVQEHELGGVLFWTVDTDDFKGTCNQQQFPLLEIASSMLYGDIKDEL